MSYQEKRIIVNIVSMVLVLVSYLVYGFGRYNSGAVSQGDLKFWASTMLIFIGIGIVATIIIQIVFHILLSISVAINKTIKNESVDDKEIEKSIELEMVEDEMDNLIGLKSNQIGFICAGVGFVAGLVTLILNYPPMVMLNMVFVSFSAGSALEGAAKLYYYRKGVYRA